jgi:RES domain-containing protein
MGLFPDEVRAIYLARQQALDALEAQGAVQVQDLHALDRLGRFMVADTLWSICDTEAREALLHDDHHSVRSAARIEVLQPLG